MSRRRIPLFPLHTVLFPGMLLPLHIFEERYRRMMEDLLAGDGLFGILLIREGEEVGGTALPYERGTLAAVANIAPLPDGRLDLIIEGAQRFQVVELEGYHPYLTGTVEILPHPAPGSKEVPPREDRLRQLISAYWERLQGGGAIGPMDLTLPQEPCQLAYMAANLLRLSPYDKQILLSVDDLGELLDLAAHHVAQALEEGEGVPSQVH